MAKNATSLVKVGATEEEIAKERVPAEDTLRTIRSFELRTQEDLELASEALVEIKDRWKQLESRKKAVTDPLNEALREVRGWFAPVQAFYVEAETVLKQKIADYHVHRDAENRAAMQAAAEAHAAGDVDAVAEIVKTIDVPEKVEGVSLRETWDFEVVSLDIVPREFLVVDAVAVRAVMRKSVAETGSPLPIPGIKFFQKTIVAARTA